MKYSSRKTDKANTSEDLYHVKYSETMTANELINSIRDVIQNVLKHK